MRRLISKIGPIGVALLLASFLGYILLAYVARVLTPNEYSAFQASWGLIFGFGSALSVVEQEISRQQANLDFDRSGPNNYPLKVCIISLCAVVPIGVAGLVSGFFERLSQELGSIGVYAVLIAVLGFIPQFVVRGVLVGREEHLQYAALLVIEPVLRLVAVAVFMYIALRESLLSYSIVAVATGSYAFSFFLIPTARFVGRTECNVSWLSILRRLAVLGTGIALSAVLITGYPAFVTAIVGTSEGLGSFFTIVTASRVPLILVAPIQAVAVPQVVRLIRGGKSRKLAQVVLRSYLLASFCAIVAFAVGYGCGPLAVHVLFGSQYSPSRFESAIVATATVMIAATQLACACLVAFERYILLAVGWGTGVAGAYLALTCLPLDLVGRATWALLTGSVMACLMTGIFVMRQSKKAAKSEHKLSERSEE
ncbi:MAG: hypothetical protein E6253_01305 [Actinomyces sp.]|nr:hypothetical protein [Actinomyces sp.]